MVESLERNWESRSPALAIENSSNSTNLLHETCPNLSPKRTSKLSSPTCSHLNGTYTRKDDQSRGRKRRCTSYDTENSDSCVDTGKKRLSFDAVGKDVQEYTKSENQPTGYSSTLKDNESSGKSISESELQSKEVSRTKSEKRISCCKDNMKYRKSSRAPAPSRCEGCGITETPEWRRGPSGKRTMCNACGLQYAKLKRGNPHLDSNRMEKHNQ